MRRTLRSRLPVAPRRALLTTAAAVAATLVGCSALFSTSALAQEKAEPAAAPERNPLELSTLITATPAEGFQLALKLSRLGVSQTQHDKSVLKAGRPEYAKDPEQLIQASQTVAINFQTVAQANNYWRDK